MIQMNADLSQVSSSHRGRFYIYFSAVLPWNAKKTAFGIVPYLFKNLLILKI